MGPYAAAMTELATTPNRSGFVPWPEEAAARYIAAGYWEGHFIYWLGPIVGAVAGALVYDNLFIEDEHEPFDHGAVRPIDTERSPSARG